MLKWQRLYQPISNGETIAYLKRGNSEKVILLIHGNMASSVHMVTLMDELKADFTVIAPDLRGFGNSTFNNPFYSIKELANDLILLFEALNIKKVDIIGWSTGFGVAMEMAILKEDLVKSIFSIEGMSLKGYYSLKKGRDGNILSHLHFNSFEEMLEHQETMYIHNQLVNNNYDFIEAVWKHTLLLTKIDDKLLNIYVLETLKQRSQAHINWCWVNFNISNETNIYKEGNSEYLKIKCPIYITLGMKDNIVVPEMIKENIRFFPHAKVFVFEDGGHCLHLEQLNKFSQIVKDVLK